MLTNVYGKWATQFHLLLVPINSLLYLPNSKSCNRNKFVIEVAYSAEGENVGLDNPLLADPNS